jgi:His/Glu/Gln/Arg/opine family amino acid ABC transporter permease subunit
MLMSLESFAQMWPRLLSGFAVTVELTALTLCIGMIVAMPVALARNARSAPLRWSAAGFIFFFRGPPVLVQLYLIYYGAPEFPWIRQSWAWVILKDPFACAVIAFSLNSAGYVAEILAGAMRNVPLGEQRAAIAAGFGAPSVFWLVTLPHAARIALRSYGNEVVFVLKGTSVASLVTVIDLMGAARQVYFRTYDPFTPLMAAGCIYLATVFVFMRGLTWMERRLSPELRLRSGPSTRSGPAP